MSTPPTETATGDADGSPNYDWQLYHESCETFAAFTADDLRKILKQDLQIEVRNAARHTLEIAVNGKKTLSPAEEAVVADMAAALAATPTAPEPLATPHPQAVPVFRTFGEAAEAAAAHIAQAFGAAFTPEALAQLRAELAAAEHRARKARRRAIAWRALILAVDTALWIFYSGIDFPRENHGHGWFSPTLDFTLGVAFAYWAICDFRRLRDLIRR